ncbi:PiggyBac transposase uribo1 [Plakobranchus ocellatus]|uniref:PiggyBac transposase uribo1 n=1 Tax=Plakobranchus ocellatus TaxID=259542 RepID=A0AAV4BJL2_9GAST|nr:PiggyBac transposase uribo1 [Plakobranchus ocellatus]
MPQSTGPSGTVGGCIIMALVILTEESLEFTKSTSTPEPRNIAQASSERTFLRFGPNCFAYIAWLCSLDQQLSTWSPRHLAKIQQKKNSKYLYDQKQVINLLLYGSSEEEEFFDSSESESFGSLLSSSDTDSEDEPRSRLLSKARAPPSKKQKGAPQASNITTLPPISAGKGKGKGKKSSMTSGKSRSRSRARTGSHTASNQDLSLDTERERHMQDLDADDDDAVDTIDIEMVNTEWLEADPDFTPQLHDFEGDSGIKFDDTDFTEVDYVAQFLNEDFWNLLVIESNRKAKQFFDTHQDFSRRSIFLSWSDTNTEEMKKFIALILLQGLVKKTTLANVLVKRSAYVYAYLCCHSR